MESVAWNLLKAYNIIIYGKCGLELVKSANNNFLASSYILLSSFLSGYFSLALVTNCLAYFGKFLPVGPFLSVTCFRTEPINSKYAFTFFPFGASGDSTLDVNTCAVLLGCLIVTDDDESVINLFGVSVVVLILFGTFIFADNELSDDDVPIAA